MKQSTITPRQKTRRISTHPLNTSSSIRPISPPLGTHPRSISAKSLSQNRLPRLSACSLSDKHQEKATDLATIEQCTHTHPHHVCKHKPQTTQHPRTWDRLSLHARQKEARTFNEESDDFTEPLPHNAPHPRILTQKIITTTF
ncbi:MAG: hypothetical protein J6M18_05165, partial [Actinomycetaceae bacterium]|nr:hypothetical protein [Actinomycetaceae bacterium]